MAISPARLAANPLHSPFVQIGALVAAAAVLGTFSSMRIRHAGEWLPTLPDTIGPWTATDTPLPAATLFTLGAPQALGREYVTQFNEPVRLSVISAGSFVSYHDPTVCVSTNGFVLTSVKTFPIDGPGSGTVRAMIFKKVDPVYGVIRMLMYYWQQTRDGQTATEAVMGSYRDIGSRFKTGFGDVVKGQQVCLVRIYAPIGPDDHNGAQTQRNVDQIAKAVYHAMKKSGSDAP
jgi:hypothetical protein